MYGDRAGRVDYCLVLNCERARLWGGADVAQQIDTANEVAGAADDKRALVDARVAGVKRHHVYCTTADLEDTGAGFKQGAATQKKIASVEGAGGCGCRWSRWRS